MHLVGPDLLEWLPLADHVELPLSVQHELGTQYLHLKLN